MLGPFQLPWIVVEGDILTRCLAEMDWLSVDSEQSGLL